jgi:hypothetical protein
MKIPDVVVERMAVAGYEATRAGRSGLPPWEGVTDYWKAGARKEMRAALEAAIAAGFVKLVVAG